MPEAITAKPLLSDDGETVVNSSQYMAYSGISKKYALLAAVCIALASGGLILFFCSSQLESRRAEVLTLYREHVAAWLNDAVRSVDIWDTSMQKLRSRVSSSETYRLFASDLFALDSDVAGNINNAEHGISFSGTAAVLSEEVPAIRRILLEFMNYNGLLDARLVNQSGQTILSALGTPPPLSQQQKEKARQAIASGKPVYLPVRPCPNGLALDVFDPVYDLENAEKRVAAFMATIPVLARITQFTARPKQHDLSTAYMVQSNNGSWELLRVPSPLPVRAELAQELARNTGNLPFGSRASVAEGGMVYSMSVFIPYLGWSIVYETPASIIERLLFRAELPVYVGGGLGWLCFMLFCGLIWWMGMGRQQRNMNRELGRLHRLVSRQKEFLDCVASSLDFGLFMADVKGQIHLSNAAFAAMIGKRDENVDGQLLFSCLPVDVASELLDNIRQAAIGNTGVDCEIRLEQDGESHLFRVTIYPFLDAGGENLRTSMRGAVVTMKDITRFRLRSERMRRQQYGLIEAFIRAEESVDPNLAGHSRRMARLAELLAVSMGLSEEKKETIIMGALLSQAGKLFISRDILAKKGRLSPQEREQVLQAPAHVYGILKDIDFDLPVAQALHEMYECMDGTGYPQGLKGDQILAEARILAVLNAFCAMTSGRSWRKSLDEKAAIAQLEESVRFDQAVVEHLKNVVDTPEGLYAARS